MSFISRFIAYDLDNGNIQDRKPIYSIPIRLLQIYCLIKRIWTINCQLCNIRHPEFVFVRLKSFKWQDDKTLCKAIEYSRRVSYIPFLLYLSRKRSISTNFLWKFSDEEWWPLLIDNNNYVYLNSILLDKCKKLSLSRFSITR